MPENYPQPHESDNPANLGSDPAANVESGDTGHAKSDTADLESAKMHARQAAEHLRSAAEAKARELRQKAEAKAEEFRSTAEAKVHEFRARAEQRYGEARARSRTLQEEGEAYVRGNPTKSVLVALATGFVLALLFRR